jgi:hypothetical protein
MATGADLPKFTADQRHRLSTLSVSEAQIKEVESIGLRWASIWLRKQPKLQDVRDELSTVSTAVNRARQALSKLLGADNTAPAAARREALLWSQVAAQSMGYKLETLEMTETQLEVAQVLLDQAQTDVTKIGQRRFRAADVFPIARIDQALLQGFVNGRDPSKPMPPYVIKVSSSPTSVFRQIVGICYEAAGAANTDPERAIKAYIAQRKKLRANQRERRVKVVTLVTRDGTPATPKE